MATLKETGDQILTAVQELAKQAADPQNGSNMAEAYGAAARNLAQAYESIAKAGEIV